MKTRTSPKIGIHRPRLLAALTLGSLSIGLAIFSFASTPSSGTLTDTSGPLSYSAGPFTQANQSPVGAGQLDVGPRCGTTGFPCDSYLLTVTMPASVAGFPDAAIKVTAGWKDTGSGQSDYDLYIFKGNVATTSGSQRANYQSASGANPEVATIFPVVADGQPHDYTIKLVPYTPSGETVNVKIEFFQGTSTGGGGTPVPSFGGKDPTVVGAPRYMNFYAPVGSAAESSSGEFNIGYNQNTGRIMVMNSGPIFRITPPEKLGKPECCEGLWEDKSNATTNTPADLDPILWTDRGSGRTFASNSTAGANGAYAFTDNDGDTYVPVGAAPPNGADHQTIATGPYPPALSVLGNPTVNHGEYVMYCSQDLIGANCQRSDDFGTVYGPAVVATGPGASNSQGCGGLHGHVRIGPDGTAYLPDKSCGSVQGGAISVDGGTTPWTEFQVKKTTADADGPAFTTTPQADGADPSIGIDKANTVYYCYVNSESTATEGHVHCAVGKRNDPANPTKINWIRDTDVGLSHGIVNAAHPETIAGDAGRAACGFLGTNVKGDYEAGAFSGVWYAFIATTYDEGRTWVTVNATPNDPVQSMTGIWQKGGSGDQGDRNLLDFNEITMDDKGRVLYGYSDGCTSAACVGGTAKSNLGAAMRVARQTGGKTLLAANDVNIDTTAAIAPKAACLRGTRDINGSHLTWTPPDNGGSDIVAYRILRSTSSGTEAFITTYSVDSTSKAEYTDTTADPNVPDYFYTIQAVNPAGTGVSSNEVDLKVVTVVVQTPCTLPGLTILTDDAGDSVGGPGTDLLAFNLAQPDFADKGQRLVFTLKTDASPGVEPAGTSYYVAMKLVNGSTTTYKAVRMYFNGATPTFESYTPGANSGGTVDGRFVTANTSKPADPSSSYTPSTGNIKIVVPIGDLGLTAGSVISGFVSAVAQPANPTGVGANAVALYDQMPNSLAYTGSYTVQGVDGCNAAPTAALRATPASGTKPLKVTFDASGSFDPDFSDTIASYTFKFGDGSADVKQASPVVDHTYSSAGSFTASVVATDSRGVASTNSAQQVITVNEPATPTPTPTPTPVASATPTPTATVTPTPSATPTPTATASPTATPTPTATASPSATPSPTASATPTPTATPTPSATPTPAPTPAAVQLLNISGRIYDRGGDTVGIGGFIVTGSGTKRVIVRAIGPSMSVNGTPVAGRLVDPTLELHDSNGGVLTNDNWRTSQEDEIRQTGLAPSDDKESAIVKRLAAGNYTAIIRGTDGKPGIGLIEVYDLSSDEAGQLGNLSVRAMVQTDDNVLIAGVILGGGASQRVLFRAIGPELKDSGVQGELQDPSLDLYDQNGTALANNDDWKKASNSAEIQATGLAPKDDRESAILMPLPAGNYTSIVRGANRSVGIAVAEAYKLN